MQHKLRKKVDAKLVQEAKKQKRKQAKEQKNG